jgi:hypothetical protein
MNPITIFKVSLPHNDFRRFNSAPQTPSPFLYPPLHALYSHYRNESSSDLLRYQHLAKTSGDVHATLTDSSFQLRPHITQLRNVASPPTVTPSARVHRNVTIAINNSVSRLQQLFAHAHLLDDPLAHRPLPLSASSIHSLIPIEKALPAKPLSCILDRRTIRNRPRRDRC